MKKKKTIFHLLNHDQTIKITEDNENNGFKYYIEHRKYKNIIYLFKDNNDENSTDVNLNRPMNLIRPIRLKKIFLAGTRIIIFKNVYACTSNSN